MKRESEDIPRDPLTGETFKFIKIKKRLRKTIWFSFIIVFLIGAIVFYYFAEPQINERSALGKELSYMKCTSFCPINTLSGYQQFSKSCTNKCYNSTLALASSAEKSALIDSEKNKQILADYNLCINGMKKSFDFNYQICFISFFAKYKDIKDLSNYLPPLY